MDNAARSQNTDFRGYSNRSEWARATRKRLLFKMWALPIVTILIQLYLLVVLLPMARPGVIYTLCVLLGLGCIFGMCGHMIRRQELLPEVGEPEVA